MRHSWKIGEFSVGEVGGSAELGQKDEVLGRGMSLGKWRCWGRGARRGAAGATSRRLNPES